LRHLDELLCELAQITGGAEKHQRRRLLLDRFVGLESLREFIAEEVEVGGFFVGHDHCAIALRSSIGRRTPARMTYRTLRKLDTDAVGSAPTRRRSALFPFSIVPVSLSTRAAFDAVAVEATITCIGVIPEACIASISA